MDISNNQKNYERDRKQSLNNLIRRCREGINGDYDDFDNVDQLMNFILTGVR